MTRPIAVLVAIAGFFTTAEFAHAQPVTSGAYRKEMVASGVFMRPQGDFRRSLQTIGYGGGFHGLFGPGRLAVGVDAQLMFYPAPRNRQQHEMLMTAHGLMRLRGFGPRRPYAEAVVGIKGFSTDTRVGTSSYGVGAGMQFPFGPTRAGTVEEELIEFGVRYLRGGGARVDFRESTSSTHSLMLHVG